MKTLANRLLYALLYAWARAHALLPMRALYVLSDIFYVLIYHLVRYRVRVVRSNLRGAFPQMSPQERLHLERRFYHHFSDYVVENIKLAGISHEELLRRAHLRNPEMVRPLLEAGHKALVLVMGHYGNWEWFTGFPSSFGGLLDVYQIYRPLDSPAFDRLFLHLRTRFGARCVPKKDVVRQLIHVSRSRRPGLFVFIADQTPSRANLHYWTNFLGHDTAMLNGPERLAVKMNLPVIYADVRRESRGHYTVDFQLLTDHPRETPEHWITEEYTRRMERTILRDPAFWLWTHRRWKYTRQPSATPITPDEQ